MKDIPVFTGAHGVASLILRQIPWSGCGYVIVRGIYGDAAAFLDECLGFCRACGAEEVYANMELQDLPAPHAYDMLRLQRQKAGLPCGSTELEELSKENSEEFLTVFNTCFRPVPNAVAYGKEELRRLLEEETAFLVRRDGRAAAVAEISKQGLEAIAVLPEYRGLGYDLALTVLQMVPSNTISLKVASTNARALALYERLGFVQTEVLSRWWKLW